MMRRSLALLASTTLVVPALAQQQTADGPSGPQGSGASSFGTRTFGGLPSLGYYDGKAWRLEPVTAAAVTMQAEGGRALLNLVRRDFLTRPVYAADFGEVCNGIQDNASSYTQAIAYAVSQTRGVQMGAGACIVASSVPINGFLPDMSGHGQGVTSISGRFDGPIFVWNVGSQNIQHFRVHDMTAGYFNNGGVHNTATSSTFMKVVGTVDGVFQHGSFDHITTNGEFAGITIAMDATPTSTGADWLKFSDITCEDGQNTGQYCIYFPNASGTGMTYDRMHTFFSGNKTPYGNGGVTYNGTATGSVPAVSAVVRFEGPSGGSLAGDQVMTDSHVQDAQVIYGIGANLGYRSRFVYEGSQIDGHTGNSYMQLPADGSFTTGVPFPNNLHIANNSVGGLVDNNTMPPVENSIVEDRDTDRRWFGSGGMSSDSPIGTSLSHLDVHTVPVATITLAPAPRTMGGGIECNFTGNGFVSGVGGGLFDQDWAISQQHGSISVARLRTTSNVGGKAGPNFFDVAASVSGLVATFSVTYRAQAVGSSNFNGVLVDCRAVGWPYALGKLL